MQEKTESAEFIKDWMPGSGAEKFVVSAYVTARKPLPAPLAAYSAVARAAPPLASLIDALVGATVPFVLGMPAPSVFGRRPPPRAAPSAADEDEPMADALEGSPPSGSAAAEPKAEAAPPPPRAPQEQPCAAGQAC